MLLIKTNSLLGGKAMVIAVGIVEVRAVMIMGTGDHPQGVHLIEAGVISLLDVHHLIEVVVTTLQDAHLMKEEDQGGKDPGRILPFQGTMPVVLGENAVAF